MRSIRELEELPFEDFQGWMSYLEVRPVGWREDLRTSFIMRAFGDKRTPEKIFPSIQSVMSSQQNSNDNLRNSAIFQKLFSAKSGDKLEVLNEL